MKYIIVNMKDEEFMGKNYVCSDIHGMKGSYEDALKELSEDDILYVLGQLFDNNLLIISKTLPMFALTGVLS